MFVIKSERKPVQAPGSRGGKGYYDEHGQWQYGERPKVKPRTLARVLLPDGTVINIRPDKREVDKEGRVTNQATIRDIINREMLGEYGFNDDGSFWARPGVLFTYQLKRIASGPEKGRLVTRTQEVIDEKTGEKKKVEVPVVERLQRGSGFVSITFTDPAVSRAYGKGLPDKLLRHRVESRVVDPDTGESLVNLPPKPDPDAPEPEGTSDIPVEDNEHITAPPDSKKRARVSAGEPLDETEDPLALATALLDTYLLSRKTSQAKTERGREKARAERKHQFDVTLGKRVIKPLPAWAVAKFESPEKLQQMLSRNGGMPLSTLITLGLWGDTESLKRNKSRPYEQLLNEWHPFLRFKARRLADAFKYTDTYRDKTKQDNERDAEYWSKQSSRRSYVNERIRDLYQLGVTRLMELAQNYVSNDEPFDSPDGRFDRVVKRDVEREMRRWSRDHAREDGALGLTVDVADEIGDNSAVTAAPLAPLTKEEMHALLHFGPVARHALEEAVKDLPEHQKEVFRSRLWFDDVKDLWDDEAEHTHLSERGRAMSQKDASGGRVSRDWGRHWVGTEQGVPSVADKLAGTIVTLKNGEESALGQLSPQLQRYYVKKWFKEAQGAVKDKLQGPGGELTHTGEIVHRWLNVEAKLAAGNARTITERTQHPVKVMPLDPAGKGPVVRPEDTNKRPSVKFFRTPGSNQELGEKLGLLRREHAADGKVSYRDPFPDHHYTGRGSVQSERVLAQADAFHKLVTNLRSVQNLSPVVKEAKANLASAKEVGHWSPTETGSVAWSEGTGVTALHEAAQALWQHRSADPKIRVQYETAYTKAANAVAEHLPAMVAEYTGKVAGTGGFTPEDLAEWRARAHANYRHHQGRMHVVEHEAARRKTAKATGADLMKAFSAYDEALDALYEVLQ